MCLVLGERLAVAFDVDSDFFRELVTDPIVFKVELR